MFVENRIPNEINVLCKADRQREDQALNEHAFLKEHVHQLTK